MVRVRDVYRDGLISGEISFPGRFVSGDADLEKEMMRSRSELAESIIKPHVDRIQWEIKSSLRMKFVVRRFTMKEFIKGSGILHSNRPIWIYRFNGKKNGL
jgi:hypothetical protein